MNRTTYFALSIIAFSLSLLGCQSDAQKMTNGLAQEYQRRYTNCNDSVQPFTRYAGFDFVDEMGVCQCNGKMCMGEEVCNIYGKCEKFKTDDTPECREGDKICISPTMGQICKNNSEGIPKWQEPIHCTGEDVCNSELSGDYICANECSESICYINEDDHKAYYSECVDGRRERTDKQCNPKASCIIEDNKSKCGECLNGELRYGNDPAICENGNWVTCLLCADGECYKHQVCIDKNNGNSEVLYITDEGKQKIVKICDEKGCNADHDCAGKSTKPCNHEGIKICDDNALEVCNSDGTLNVTICANGCNEEKNDCNPEAPKQDPECRPGETQCVGNQIKTCTDGVWSNPHDCDEGKVCIGKECQLKPSYDKCKKGETKCDGEQIKTCTNGEWGNAENCPNPEEVCKSETQKCGAKLDPPACNDGETQCEGNSLQTCTGGKWDEGTSCENGCNSNIIPNECKCNERDTECKDGYFSYCYGNSWQTNICNETADDKYHTCKDHTDCIHYCIDDNDGEVGYEHSYVYSGSKFGFEDKSDACPGYFSCKVDDHKLSVCGDCKNNTIQCNEDKKTIETCDNGQWNVVEECPNGCTNSATSGAYCNTCSPNDYKCDSEGKIYMCNNDGSGWISNPGDKNCDSCKVPEQIVNITDSTEVLDQLCGTVSGSTCDNTYYECHLIEGSSRRSSCNEKGCSENTSISLLTIRLVKGTRSPLIVNCNSPIDCAKLFNKDIEKFIDIQDKTCSNKTNTDEIVLTGCNFNETITKLSGSYYIELDLDEEFDGYDEIKDKINKYKSKVEFLVKTNDGIITITQRKDH